MYGHLPISRSIEHQEEYGDRNIEESSPESPRSSLLGDTKMASTSTLKRSKRGMQKKIVSVPIKDVEGSQRSKGENAAPPTDSWAWRKYGQKPIKGSPYPRGYYRCSSYKGCPARKQVERNKVDPSMLLITYSFEHNHPWPLANRNHHSQSVKSSSTDGTKHDDGFRETPEIGKLGNEEELVVGKAGEDDFCWFGGMESAHSTIIGSPVFSESSRAAAGTDMPMIFPMREEDESLFADLGELPECSAVFQPHRGAGPQMQIC